VDLDGDGKLDILSGSWPGELFLFRGNGKGFDEPEMIKNKTGEYINIGGGIRDDRDGMLLIAGNATFEDKDGRKFIKYHGKEIPYNEDKGAGITGTASAVHAFDWDSDGDLDLLVGEIGGVVYLVPNEGSKTKYAFGKEQRLIDVSGGDAGPFVCDWDGDSKHDLLVGCGDGSVRYYRNVGSAKAPKLDSGVTLLPSCEVEHSKKASSEPKRGIRSKVWAADWNGDGKLDLLVGDFTTQRPAPKTYSDKEKEELAKARKELDEVRKRSSELIQKIHGRNKVADKEERKKIGEELNKVQKRWIELSKKVPPEYENHGWVWLYLRKPGPIAAN